MAMERYVSTDVLVEILQRLPPSSRRRARLVCQRWRDVVNNRTTEMQSRPKLLIWDTYCPVAYVADDLSSSSTASYTELWSPSRYQDWQLVGTCNGLLCLCDNNKIVDGAINLLNPATGETLPIPPLPCAGQFIGSYCCKKWGDAYSFAYHPTTGQYKIVHVPCSYERVCDFHVVHVLTLGEARWREVSAGPGGAICNLDAGIVSVDGMTYWVRVTGCGAAKIVSFDLMDERVTSTTTPVPVRHDIYHLTEVHGRLGFVASRKVWVLEEGQQWSHKYSFEQGIPRRHFVYGECVLTCKELCFYGHHTKGKPSSNDDDAMLVGHHDEGTLVAKMTRKKGSIFNGYYETFAYVETTEPLKVYAS